MSRSMSKCNLLVVVLFLFIVGCDDVKQQPAITNENQAAPCKLVDPLERDKDVLAMNKPGRWSVQGEDRDGNHWQGYLVVEQSPDAYMTKGFFEWSSRRGTEIGGGRYQFEGTYDPETRMVRWTGFTVENRLPGGAANAHYEATLSPDGRELLNGSWQGGISLPGTWKAEFFGEL